MNKRPAVINAHCHLLNLYSIPEDIVKLLAHINKDTLDNDWLSKLSVLTKIIPGKDYDQAQYFLETYNKRVHEVAEDYLVKLIEAKIDVCVPLMMDLFKSCEENNINEKKLVPYETQIQLMSALIKSHPWKIFPFVMFDPRRKKSDEICIKALKHLGFTGVKMYPALGYHPNPECNVDDFVQARMENLYRYCGKNEIPITTHASIGGAYNVKITGEQGWIYTDINNWLQPIEKYKLKVNFAHFGGNYINQTNNEKLKKSKEWREDIKKAMQKYSIYADLSYHDMALGKINREELKINADTNAAYQYFKDLSDLLGNNSYKNKILFGTDASMISHTWTEAQYIKPFKNIENLTKEKQNLIFNNNPVSFLFEKSDNHEIDIPDTEYKGQKLPDNYISFIKKYIPEKIYNEPLPEWIYMDNDEFFIIKY